MTILNNGYVGIGTNAPKDVLHLHKAALQVSNADGNGQLLTIGQLCVAPGNSAYSSLARKGDVVFRTFNYDSSTTDNNHDIIITAHTNLGGIRFATGDRTDVERLTIFHDGNVIVKGSGQTVSNLGYNFGVNGGNAAVRAAENYPALLTLMPYGNGNWWNLVNANNGSRFVITAGDKKTTTDGGTNWDNPMFMINADGQVGIGTSAPNSYKLAVNGKIVCREDFRVIDATGAFPDFVFDDGYKLMPLDTLEGLIRATRHLPEIPGAAEVARDGISVVGIQTKMLQKIEELTLYVIDQDKRIKALEEQNRKLQAQIDNGGAR